MKKIILIGAGAHCKVVIDAARFNKEIRICGIIDKKEKVGSRVLGIPVIGEDDDLKEYFKKGVKSCFITVGCVGYPETRIRIYKLAKAIGFDFPNIIHPRAVVSKSAGLGRGNFIGAGAVINAGALIAGSCIINTNSVIEHDCVVGDFVHIAPAVVLGGKASIGRCSHIGMGAIVIQEVKIGKNTVIGAGSVVLKDMPDNSLAFGMPCKKTGKISVR